MEKHVTFVAALNIGFGALGVMIGIIIFAAVFGGGLLSGEPETLVITLVVGSVVGFFFIAESVLEIIGGLGLLKYKPWARILILVIACLDLLFIPIGTIIGIYEIWVLLNDKTIQLFKEASSS